MYCTLSCLTCTLYAYASPSVMAQSTKAARVVMLNSFLNHAQSIKAFGGHKLSLKMKIPFVLILPLFFRSRAGGLNTFFTVVLRISVTAKSLKQLLIK